MPPSGNDLGSFGFNGCLSGSAFSRSGGFMSVMGMDWIGSIISMLCFHSDANVAEDGVLVELIMMGTVFGADRQGGNIFWQKERESGGGFGGGEGGGRGRKGKKRKRERISVIRPEIKDNLFKPSSYITPPYYFTYFLVPTPKKKVTK